MRVLSSLLLLALVPVLGALTALGIGTSAVLFSAWAEKGTGCRCTESVLDLAAPGLSAVWAYAPKTGALIGCALLLLLVFGSAANRWHRPGR